VLNAVDALESPRAGPSRTAIWSEDFDFGVPSPSFGDVRDGFDFASSPKFLADFASEAFLARDIERVTLSLDRALASMPAKTGIDID
jgi:hypothetical protein